MSAQASADTPPILVLACRRPQATRRLLQQLTSAGLPQIHVVVDGPNPVAGDARLVELTREVVRSFDLPESNLQLRSKNLGGPRGIPEAIDWFFSSNDRGIIIEDDLLPDPTFLPFAAELLRVYEKDARVAAIHGWSNQLRPSLHSYFFSRYAPGWGWATWASRWKDFDREARLWAETDHLAVLRNASQGDESFVAYWMRVFHRVYVEGDVNWDYRWVYTNFVLGRLTANAGVNLVENTGFGTDATHTNRRPYFMLPTARMKFPLDHPPEVSADLSADRHRHRTTFLQQPWLRVRYLLHAARRYIKLRRGSQQ